MSFKKPFIPAYEDINSKESVALRSTVEPAMKESLKAKLGDVSVQVKLNLFQDHSITTI